MRPPWFPFTPDKTATTKNHHIIMALKINIPPYKIRPLEAHDIPAVVSLDRKVFKDPWPESAYIQELYFNPNAHYFVLQLMEPVAKRWRLGRRAARDAKLLGFMGMRVEMGHGHISTIAIRPEWRHRGLGELLLITAIKQSIKDNADNISLEVRVSNVTAQNLYEKYGFETISRLHQYYGDREDAYLMRTGPLDFEYQWYVDSRFNNLVAQLEIAPIREG